MADKQMTDDLSADDTYVEEAYVDEAYVSIRRRRPIATRVADFAVRRVQGSDCGSDCGSSM